MRPFSARVGRTGLVLFWSVSALILAGSVAVFRPASVRVSSNVIALKPVSNGFREAILAVSTSDSETKGPRGTVAFTILGTDKMYDLYLLVEPGAKRWRVEEAESLPSSLQSDPEFGLEVLSDIMHSESVRCSVSDEELGELHNLILSVAKGFPVNRSAEKVSRLKVSGVEMCDHSWSTGTLLGLGLIGLTWIGGIVLINRAARSQDSGRTIPDC